MTKSHDERYPFFFSQRVSASTTMSWCVKGRWRLILRSAEARTSASGIAEGTRTESDTEASRTMLSLGSFSRPTLCLGVWFESDSAASSTISRSHRRSRCPWRRLWGTTSGFLRLTREAVRVALKEFEAFAATRVRTERAESDRVTGKT